MSNTTQFFINAIPQILNHISEMQGKFDPLSHRIMSKNGDMSGKDNTTKKCYKFGQKTVSILELIEMQAQGNENKEQAKKMLGIIEGLCLVPNIMEAIGKSLYNNNGIQVTDKSSFEHGDNIAIFDDKGNLTNCKLFISKLKENKNITIAFKKNGTWEFDYLQINRQKITEIDPAITNIEENLLVDQTTDMLKLDHNNKVDEIYEEGTNVQAEGIIQYLHRVFLPEYQDRVEKFKTLIKELIGQASRAFDDQTVSLGEPKTAERGQLTELDLGLETPGTNQPSKAEEAAGAQKTAGQINESLRGDHNSYIGGNPGPIPGGVPANPKEGILAQETDGSDHDSHSQLDKWFKAKISSLHHSRHDDNAFAEGNPYQNDPRDFYFNPEGGRGGIAFAYDPQDDDNASNCDTGDLNNDLDSYFNNDGRITNDDNNTNHLTEPRSSSESNQPSFGVRPNSGR